VSAAETPIDLRTTRQREIADLLAGGNNATQVGEILGITRWAVREHARKARMRAAGVKPKATRVRRSGSFWDPLESETREAAAVRVAGELAGGLRCRHPMRSGRPCSLLLPCADHETKETL
jgi:DNA-binding NarL/FixJ family response regulator